MAAVKQPRRAYSSGLRQEQARRTRLRILESAERLFQRDGYAATTIDRIAATAGVATDTVYAVFRSKRSVLSSLLDLRVGGDDQAVPMLERSAPQQMRRERSQRRQIAKLAAGVSQAVERARPIDDIMRTAAAVDPEIARLRARVQEERFTNMVTIAKWLQANGPLRGDRSVEEAGAIIWSLTSPEIHRLLRTERGWDLDQYRRWLEDTLARTLLRA